MKIKFQPQSKGFFASSRRLNMSKAKFVIYAVCIFVCFFLFGILQEKITKSEYGEKKEKFTFMLSLVFMQCVVNSVFAKIILTIKSQGEDTTRTLYYASSALTYLLAMLSSYKALQWVNYPTQVIAKSGKPIPVMILGVLLGRKSYPFKKYVFVIMIVTGIIMFMFKDQRPGLKVESTYGFGEALLVLSLTMDGLLGAIQERMRGESQTKSGHMMLNMNMWSVLYSGAGILVTNELLDFVEFVGKYPEVIPKIAVFCLLCALGQLFIFLTVSGFGPLPCSIVTTTRKFFTILASVFFVGYGNTLSIRQWVATAVVFLGLTLDIMYGDIKSSTDDLVRIVVENAAEESKAGGDGEEWESEVKVVENENTVKVKNT